MACSCYLILIASLIVLVSFFLLSRKSDVKLTEDIFKDHYWGKRVLKDGEPLPKDDATIKPMKVTYDEAMIKDLHSRLEKTRFVEPLNDRNDFENGFNGDYLKKVVQHWRNNYDWKKQVDKLNSHPQFTTQIEGLNVHFVRIKPLGNAKIIKPIMLVNGWPSNFNQYYKLAELLRKPVNDVAFEIILPSRPGFGFSEQPHRTGFASADSVRIYVKLMKRLGIDKFYYAGEDWGSIEAHAIAAMYPDNLEGVHFSMALTDFSVFSILKQTVGAYLPNLVYSTEIEKQSFASPLSNIKGTIREMGYFMIQSTKPDTIGSLLIDSPAGLAAYYLEKFSTGVNKDFLNLADGGLTKVLTLDELLTNIMIFWSTQNAAYATRYYKEFSGVAFGSAGVDVTKAKVSDKVPIGFTVGEHELSFGKQKPSSCRYGNIVKHDYLPGVGHFAAFEAPAKLDEHLREFVSIVMKQNEKSKDKEL